MVKGGYMESPRHRINLSIMAGLLNKDEEMEEWVENNVTENKALEVRKN
jgi:hypothetical protein